MADDDADGATTSGGGSATTTAAGSDRNWKKGLKAAGKSMSAWGQGMLSNVAEEAGSRSAETAPSYRKGGKVRKTGLIKAHRGEEVVPSKDAKKVRRFLKRRKGKRGSRSL